MKNDAIVCNTAATPATATAVSELPLNLSSGVRPLMIATLFTNTEKPTSRKLNTAYAAGATGTAEIIASGKILVTTVRMKDSSVTMPMISVRENSLRILWFSSKRILFSSSSPV